MNEKKREVRIRDIETYERVKIDFHPKNPPLEKTKDKTKIDVRYTLISPFAFVHIHWNEKISELVYEVEEPILNTEEIGLRLQLTDAVRNLINFENVVDKSEDALLEYIDKRMKLLAMELGMDMSYESYRKIYYYLCRDFIGFNEIEPVLRDYFVEDIECNGVNSPVYIIHRIYRNIKTNVNFKDMDKLERIEPSKPSGEPSGK